MSAHSQARPRGSWAMVAAFVLGVPAGVGLLVLIHLGPLDVHEEIVRYVSHPVEWVEVVLFCCALAALFAKAVGQVPERAARRYEVLPAWEGTPLPVADAGPLLSSLRHLSAWMRNTFLVRRVAGILDFVTSRGSANGLDDHMRGLSDSDALAVEGSNGLVRFITWAIPILGFLGTVLGITEAIYGVTPEVLEKSLDGVTSGLATAFDTTALALGLTMILMFVNFLVERLEQGTLADIDHYVDDQLAHRFERTGPESGQFVEALRHNTQVLLKAAELLVERQAGVWARTVEKAERFWAEGAQKQLERFTHALEAALEKTLASHAQWQMELERQAIQRSQALQEGLINLAGVLRDTGREHQAALAEVAYRVTQQAEVLGRLQEGEANLVRLQETLQQNLASLAGASSFDQAVESLTAAIHLLTARTGATPAPRLQVRPAA